MRDDGKGSSAFNLFFNLSLIISWWQLGLSDCFRVHPFVLKVEIAKAREAEPIREYNMGFLPLPSNMKPQQRL
jgi:hypothetical protein